MNKNLFSHPAFHNPQILAIRRQQLNNDLDKYIKEQENENEQILLECVPLLSQIYNTYKVNFMSLAEGFDNVCYNIMIPICNYYGNLLFAEIQRENSIINNMSFQDQAILNLLNMLFELSYKTLWTEYKEFVLAMPDEKDNITEEEINRMFIAEFENEERVHYFFHKYPILAKLLSDMTEIWFNKHSRIFNYLSQDILSVCKYFNISLDTSKLIDIQEINISGDSHDKNNFVAVVKFDKNQIVVLKNRTANPETTLRKAIDFLSEKQIDLKAPALLTIGEHHWMEFIENKACECNSDFCSYYERIGNLTALLYALNAGDIHYENIIANGAFPVIIDAECLFSSNTDFGYLIDVLNIGLLPSDLHIGLEAIWIGGTDNAAEQNALFSHWHIDENYQTKEETGKLKNANNTPFLKSGKSANVIEYIQHIKNGFCRVYDLILQHKNDFVLAIEQEFPLKVRYLNRPTYTYTHLLRQSLFATYLKNIFEYNWVFEWIWVNADVNLKYNALVPYELEMLKKGFVPYFQNSTNSTDLQTVNHEIIQKNFFSDNAEKMFYDKIESFSDKDRKIQLKIIDMQFQKLSNKDSMLFSSQSFFKQVINRIETSILPIANTIEAFDYIEGDVKRVEINLYDGYAGYLLFLIYYREIYKDSSVNNLIITIYDKIIFEVDNYGEKISIGAFIGISGCLYVLTHLYLLEPKSTYIDEIRKIENLILGKVNEENTTLGNDILSGIAGCIICLHNVHKALPSENTKLLIIRLAEILVSRSKKIDDNIIGWVSKTGMPLVGYSHGSAGMGQALLVAYELTGNRAFLENFEMCLNFENNNFDKDKRFWKDTRDNIYKNVNTSWCNGTTGIGLARINYLKYCNNKIIHNDIEAALKTTLELGTTDCDVLCHGNWGTIELLLYYYQNNSKNEYLLKYIDKIKEYLLGRIDNNQIKCNNKNNILSISFMTGLTGIAYELLRIENPDIVPSVLLLENSPSNK